MSKPNATTHKCLIWLPQDGKERLLDSALPVELINNGYTVVSADLPGVGELFDPKFRGDGFVKQVPFNYTFGANLTGKSIPGIQAEALDLLVQFINKEFPETRTDVLTEGTMNAALLHYAVLKNPFGKIVLIDPLASNLSLIQTEYFDPKLAYGVVPGSLKYYDFSDMISLLPSDSLKEIIQADEFTIGDHDSNNKSEILNFLLH
jgi:hypothetical protein